MLPRWVIDEDIEHGSNIKNLTQILASYFDTLQIQIQSLSTLREATYSTYTSASISSSAKPLPFAGRLLEGLGLETPELFIDAEIIEKLSSRDEKREFEVDLHDIKNLIYHNIYNNLSYIYKSKGTEKSFRNLIRCFGIDDELIKLNIYGNDADYKFRDNFKSTVIRKSVVDFNDPTRFGATVYQYPEGAEYGYISGLNGVIEDMPCTFEAEILFPRKRVPGEIGYFNTKFITSSLFGAHGVKATSDAGSDTTWYDPGVDTFVDNPNFQVYAIRTSSMGHDTDTKDAYFMLTSSTPFPFSAVTSSVYSDVYDNTKWNFAVKLRHDKHKQINVVLGTTGSVPNSAGDADVDDSYSVEFYGVNTILDEVINEFVVTSSVRVDLAEPFIQANKRMYIGAHRTNFSGSTILQKTDIKASSLRFWYNYLDDETIKAHAKDPTNFGLKNPYRHLSVFHSGANNVYTPAIESLALNWDFETVTGSDANGRFNVLDFSSGSEKLSGRYQSVGLITKRRHPGRGDFFVASTTASIDKNYFHIAKQQLPEFIYSSDMINIVDEDDPTFTRESRPTQFFFAAEKSMYQTISEEMINMFATIVDFNNSIGETVNRYRQDYKDLTKLRQLFFERIDNTVDLDKYVDYYKWIDHSITIILKQLMPASANVSDDLRTMVENHILVRNKHFNKFPRLVKRGSDFELKAIPKPPLPEPTKPESEKPSWARAYAINNNQVDAIAINSGEWQYNVAPLPTSPPPQNKNSAWWYHRAERSHPTITSGDPDVDRSRDQILSASSTTAAAFRTIGSIMHPSFGAHMPIHGGVNFSKNKRIRYAHQATTEFGPTTTFTVGPYSVTVSNNFVLFKKSGIEPFFDSVDEIFPNEINKKKFRFSAYNNSEAGDDYNILKGSTVVPFSLYKHNNVLIGGYHDLINDQFKEGVDFTNLHVDVYGPDNETPMQGPFTEKHVGGLQHRHVDINKFVASNNTSNNLDDDSTRPEALYLLMGALLSGEEAVGIVGPTYTTTGKYDKDTPRARFYRGLTAKSPVNIRNIRTTGSMLGNYSNTIEYVHTVGRLENNKFFKENGGVSLPSRYAVGLPKTTNAHSLVGIGVSTEGNIIGPSLTNLNNTSNRVASDTQFSLPRRDLTGSNSVIVSRFSAPGGPEINSRGYLDIMAEEYSVHNALPFRNLAVRSSGSGEAGTIRSEILAGAGRDGLRTLLTRHQGQFGIDSQFGSIGVAGYNTTPSFHKIHRNSLKRIESPADVNSNELPSSLFSTTTTTASVHDNYWVQHPIPRSDLQYKWLTASFLSYPDAVTLGHAPADGLVSSSVEGVVSAYNFVSASHVTNSSGVVASFAGFNTIVVDGINSSQNLLSASNFPDDYVSSLGNMDVVPETVNAVLLHRHGPYQWPSWKQIRGAENAIVRYQRKRNIFSITTPAKEAFTSAEMEALIPQKRGGKLRHFVEPPITSKHKPIVHVLSTVELADPFDYGTVVGGGSLVPSGIKYTFANNKEMFPTDEVNFILGLKNTSRGTYDELSDLYLVSSTGTPASLGTQFVLLSYRETIFPQPENAYLSGSRSRLTFNHPEWKSGANSRTELNRTSSMGFTVANQSSWPLDARKNFIAATRADLDIPATGSGAGELQNGYTHFHNGQNLGSASISTKSVKFGRRAYLSASQVHSTGTLGVNYLSSSVVSFWFKTAASDVSSNTSASFVSRGRSDSAASGEKMHFDVRLEQNEIYANIGSVRGDEDDEIVFKKTFSENFGTKSGLLNANHWSTASVDISVKQDKTVSPTTYAAVLSGSGTSRSGDMSGVTGDRWFKTTHRHKGPLTVAYSYLAGGTGTNYADLYDPSGLRLQRPEYDTVNSGGLDSLYLQYSVDGTAGTWTTAKEHRGYDDQNTGADSLSPDFVGGVWFAHTASIDVSDFVYLRWFQDEYAHQPAHPSADHWAVNDITITSDNHSLSDDSWHHVALAWYYDSSTNHSMSLYVDGERRAVGSTGVGYGPSSGFGSYAIVGGNPPDNAGTFSSQTATIGLKGQIDELTFFTGSIYDTGSQGTPATGSSVQWNNSVITALYNSGNPIDVNNTILSSSGAGNLTVLSHYQMGDHQNDGILAQASGTIQDTVSNNNLYTGNLSASVSDLESSSPHSGFSSADQGIVNDAPFSVNAGGNTNIFGPLYARYVPEKDLTGKETNEIVGDTLWEAAVQAGKEPFYNSYDDYREEMRGTAKDYTIVPEFRISEHMEYYLDTKGGNFLVDNENFLELTGAATDMTSSKNNDFFKVYTNTDFMKFFDVIKQDHSDDGHEPTRFALKCNAVMKFLPYKGFYPASRTVELATLFSKSYAERINFKDLSATTTAAAFGNQVSFKTFLTPLFAPGILYNSIKSGLAVDYPIMTSSYSVAGVEVINDFTASARVSSSYGYRAPFEALVLPENYLAGVTILDGEVHTSASIVSTASWDGSGGPLYKSAMNNFVAEIPKFFLKDEGVTSLISAKDDNKKYFKAESGKEYRMRVVLRNGRVSRRRQLELTAPRDNSAGQDVTLTGSFFTSPTITMYSRRSAFGPPTRADYIQGAESFEPHTPPYMDGYADVEMTFRPEETRFYFIDEIVSNLTESFFRVGEQYFTVGSGINTPAYENQMHITSSINIFDIAKEKKGTFDPVTGETILVEDDANAPSVAIIQPKWETPILDFSNVSVTLPTIGSGSVSRGMWHQYGSEPLTADGVFLEVQDLTKEELNNPALTGSLADLMGFSKSPVKLGQVLEEKIIREAIVAIPFIENGTTKEFFNIPEYAIEEAHKILREAPSSKRSAPSELVGQSIVDMIGKMRHYVFPPKFDFLTNKTVKPVAMYIFEFEHTLSKQDLIDIWQNLPPKIGRKFETKSVVVSHDLSENELMNGEIKDTLRWMVFKVKQRAADNYFKMLTDSVHEEGFKFELLSRKGITKDKNEYNYSYNWPYDFFSLVELVKMDAEVVIENKNNIDEE